MKKAFLILLFIPALVFGQDKRDCEKRVKVEGSAEGRFSVLVGGDWLTVRERLPDSTVRGTVTVFPARMTEDSPAKARFFLPEKTKLVCVEKVERFDDKSIQFTVLVRPADEKDSPRVYRYKWSGNWLASRLKPIIQIYEVENVGVTVR